VPFANVGGIRLYYEHWGQGSPVVLIPGLGADSRLFQPLARQLSAAHRVVAFDPRGSGRSDKPAGPYSIEQMTGDLRELIADLDLGVCDVVGYSMGGRVALNFAAEHPHEVRRLVLAATSARGIPTRRFSARWFALDVIGRLPTPRWFDPQPQSAFQAQRQASAAFDGRAKLARVQAATLIVRASNDHMVPAELTAELGAIPHCQDVTLPGGHISLLTRHSAELASTIGSFLAESD
jgi:pimeloyl-ACP methyl ester carboxylesterase